MQKAQQEKMVGGGPSNIVLSKKSIKGIEGIKINVIKIENIQIMSFLVDGTFSRFSIRFKIC